MNTGRFHVMGPILALATLATAPLIAAIPADAPPVVEAISVDQRPDGLVLNVRLSLPPRSYILRWPVPPSQEAVLELPGAVHQLEANYRFDGPFLRGARVEEARGDVPGVILRIALGEDATIAAVEQVGAGLRLHLVPAAADRDTLPSSYRVGIGDKIEIAVFGHEDLTKVVEVQADGTINFPMIGDLRVAGKSVTEVDTDLTRRLSEDFLVDPQVSVDIREYQSQWATIIGEVRNPGRYYLKRNMRLIDLLAEAGGVTKEAGTVIKITRRSGGAGGSEQILVERERLLAGDNDHANIPLQHADIVAVSEKEVFYIRGEVNKPGPYYLEKDMTILKAISVAGGLGPFSNYREIELLRAEAGGRQKKIRVNLKAIENGKSDDIPLRPNDTIIVPRRLF